MTGVTGESLYVPVGTAGDELHLRRLRRGDLGGGPPVLMVHGAIENGRIFYSTSGKGIAPYLAARGFDVFVADLRGRGASRPHVHRRATYGQTEMITQDIPALARRVATLTDGRPQHWLGHSWGGVLLASHLVRFGAQNPPVASLTCFGTKRSIAAGGAPKFWAIDVVWCRLAPLLAGVFGYFPAPAWGMGADDEPRHVLRQCIAWLPPQSRWTDPADGFDYHAAAATTPLPPTRHYTGAADAYLGNAADVRRFMTECRTPPAALRVVGRATGHRRDYGHVALLTHPDAPEDLFRDVEAWLRAAVH